MADWAATPAPPKAAAPVTADWAAAPAKPAAAPASADWATDAPEKPGVIGQAARDFASPFVEGWDALVKDFGEAKPSVEDRPVHAPGLDMLKGWGDQLKATGRVGLDVLGLAGAPVSGLARATVGRGLTKLPGPYAEGPEGERKAFEAVDTALMGARPAKGGALPRAPKEPVSAAEPPAIADWARPAEAPAEVPAPPPTTILEAPPGVEAPKQAATRIDDGLYRLRTNATADKIEADKFIKAVPQPEMDPAFQERAYAEMEQRMVDPKAKLSPEVETFYETTLKPFRTEERANYEAIKRRMGDDYTGDIPGYEGYVRRVVQGKDTRYDAADPENFTQHDAVAGGPRRTLTTFSPSQMERKFWVLEKPDGSRAFLPGAPEGAAHGAEVPGGVLKHATTAEIEANTQTRYYKNPLVNTIDNVLSQRRVIRNLDLLDQMKPEMSRAGFASMAKNAPEGFVETTLPQLKGWKFEPQIADTLNDFHGEVLRGGKFDQGLQKLNRFLTTTIFYNPIPHIMNVGTHWAPARGFDWIRPGAYKSLFVDGATAIKEVATQGQLYRDMLREGAPMLYGDVAQANFHKLMLEKMFNEQMTDPQTWGGIAKTLGFKTVKDLVKAEYRAASKALWAGSDMFMMQRILELERKGMPRREAIHEASRDIPAYRVPSEVMGSRGMAELLKSNRYLMFGRYKYGQFKAYSEMIKDMVGKGTDRFGRPQGESVIRHQQREAAGKLMVLALMGTVAYPLADEALRSMSGNDEASMKRSGPFSIPQAAYDLTQGQKDWASTVSSIMTLAPALSGAVDVGRNTDWAGRPIVEPKSTNLGQAAQAGEFAASQVGPGQSVLRGVRQGPGEAIADMFGVKLPTDEQKSGKLKGEKAQRGRAKSREKKDPIEGAIRGMFE